MVSLLGYQTHRICTSGESEFAPGLALARRFRRVSRLVRTVSPELVCCSGVVASEWPLSAYWNGLMIDFPQSPNWYLIWIGSDQEKTFGPTIAGLIHNKLNPDQYMLWDSKQRGLCFSGYCGTI